MTCPSGKPSVGVGSRGLSPAVSGLRSQVVGSALCTLAGLVVGSWVGGSTPGSERASAGGGGVGGIDGVGEGAEGWLSGLLWSCFVNGLGDCSVVLRLRVGVVVVCADGQDRCSIGRKGGVYLLVGFDSRVRNGGRLSPSLLGLGSDDRTGIVSPVVGGGGGCDCCRRGGEVGL